MRALCSGNEISLELELASRASARGKPVCGLNRAWRQRCGGRVNGFFFRTKRIQWVSSSGGFGCHVMAYIAFRWKSRVSVNQALVVNDCELRLRLNNNQASLCMQLRFGIRHCVCFYVTKINRRQLSETVFNAREPYHIRVLPPCHHRIPDTNSQLANHHHVVVVVICIATRRQQQHSIYKYR